jgi:uncharacterized protein (DUF305 family)
MRNSSSALIAASMLALLSACSGGGGESEDQTAAAPAEQAPGDNMAAMASDPNNPYGQAEMQMHERMMAAQGANASETWVRKMIEHHRGAIAMNDIVIGLGGEPAVIEKARKTSEDQRKEIQQLERMLQAGGIGTGTSGNANPFTQSEQTMHNRMMAAMGANPSETWIRKMIEHHRGAVEMSNILTQQGGDPKVLEMARMTAQKQQKEIGELERMLTGATPAEPVSARSAAEAPEATPKAEPAPKADTKASPKAEPQPKAEAAPKAEPKAQPKAPAAKETCAPEHRAMGHC